MIEINQRAKPKAPLHTLALALGLHYILNDGIIILMEQPFGESSLLGRAKRVPEGLSFAQNPGLMKENGPYGGLWNKATGLFQGMENYPDHPYHVKCLAGTPWNPTPSVEELWEYWETGGALQWKMKTKGEDAWASYYMKPHSILTLSQLKVHFAIHDLRKKP